MGLILCLLNYNFSLLPIIFLFLLSALFPSSIIFSSLSSSLGSFTTVIVVRLLQSNAFSRCSRRPFCCCFLFDPCLDHCRCSLSIACFRDVVHMFLISLCITLLTISIWVSLVTDRSFVRDSRTSTLMFDLVFTVVEFVDIL